MPDSYIDQKTQLMHQLLWNTILRQYVAIELVALPLGIPVVGPFISMCLANPIIQGLVLDLISHYIEIPLFTLLCRWGVFTSVDWKEDSIYNAYEEQANKLLPLQGKPAKDWTPEEDKAFSDAAANLIRLHIPGWSA